MILVSTRISCGTNVSWECNNNNNNNNNNNDDDDDDDDDDDNMTLFNEGNIIYWLPGSLQYGPP